MAARMPALVANRWRTACRCVPLLAVLMSAGCFSPFTASNQIVQRCRPTTSPTALSQETVMLDVAVLEVPLTDRTSLASVWTSADEQIVPAEHKARLEDNGFRVGVVGGIPPAALLTLLTSDRTNPSPHQWIRKPGDAKVLTIGNTIADCQCQIAQVGESSMSTFENAQCAFSIVPGIKGDEVSLQFTPQIQHGKRNLWPSADGVGNWMMQGQRPIERWTALKFELALANSEYVLVGMRDKPSSLGEAFFRASGDRPVERLIVIRAGRSASAGDPIAQSGRGFQPLAVQAAQTRVRGVSADR